VSDERSLDERLSAWAAAPEDGRDWEDVLRRAGVRRRHFPQRPFVLALAAAIVVAATLVGLFVVRATRTGGAGPPGCIGPTGPSGAIPPNPCTPSGVLGATGVNGATGEGPTGHRGATGQIGATGAAPGPSGRVGPTGFPFPSTSRIVFGPVGFSADELKAKALTLGAPIYWAGPAKGDKYELTRTRLGRLFLRYLPQDVPVGTRGGNFLVVATSPQSGAFEVLTHQAGGGIFSGPGGSVIDANTNDPNSVLLAFPHVDEQIEIYDLRPGKALAIARSGDIRPVG
jgi:hypothetical protein